MKRQKKLKLTKDREKMLNAAIQDVMKRPVVTGNPPRNRRLSGSGFSFNPIPRPAQDTHREHITQHSNLINPLDINPENFSIQAAGLDYVLDLGEGRSARFFNNRQRLIEDLDSRVMSLQTRYRLRDQLYEADEEICAESIRRASLETRLPEVPLSNSFLQSDGTTISWNNVIVDEAPSLRETWVERSGSGYQLYYNRGTHSCYYSTREGLNTRLLDIEFTEADVIVCSQRADEIQREIDRDREANTNAFRWQTHDIDGNLHTFGTREEYDAFVAEDNLRREQDIYSQPVTLGPEHGFNYQGAINDLYNTIQDNQAAMGVNNLIVPANQIISYVGMDGLNVISNPNVSSGRAYYMAQDGPVTLTIPTTPLVPEMWEVERFPPITVTPENSQNETVTTTATQLANYYSEEDLNNELNLLFPDNE